MVLIHLLNCIRISCLTEELSKKEGKFSTTPSSILSCTGCCVTFLFTNRLLRGLLLKIAKRKEKSKLRFLHEDILNKIMKMIYNEKLNMRE